jgi:WD40 repeat protein
MNHNARISRIEFSRDGRLFLTAGSDTKIELWVSRTGEPVGAPLRTAKEITSAHFSPSQEIVAAGDGDGVLHLWTTSTLKPLKQFSAGSTEVSAFEFSPDGQLVAAASGDTATMWNVSSGQQLGELLRHTSPVTAIRFSADSKRIATGTDDGTVRLWDASTGLSLSEKLLHEKGIRDLVFSPDGKILVGCSRDRAVKAWDVSARVTAADHQALAELARSISPLHLSDSGQLEPREIESLDVLRSHLKDLSGSAHICAEWLMAEPTKRTLTPYNRETLSSYVKQLVQENDNKSQADAVFLATGDQELLHLIGSDAH